MIITIAFLVYMLISACHYWSILGDKRRKDTIVDYILFPGILPIVLFFMILSFITNLTER